MRRGSILGAYSHAQEREEHKQVAGDLLVDDMQHAKALEDQIAADRRYSQDEHHL